MEFDQKKIREIELFDFTSFFGLHFFKFCGPLWIMVKIDLEASVIMHIYDNGQTQRGFFAQNIATHTTPNQF